MTPEERILRAAATENGLSTEDMIRNIHGWLEEIMPAARVAMKMMDARANLVKRWRGGKG